MVPIAQACLVAGHDVAVAAPAVAWDELMRLHALDESPTDLLKQPLNRGRRSAAGDVITPRYYQAVAINRVLAAVARGSQRVLLLMATGESHEVARKFRLDRFATGHLLDEEGTGSQHNLH